MPLYDYCDVVCLITAKLTSMVERVHSKFVKKLPFLSILYIFSFSFMELCRFHTAVQIFKSLQKQSPPYLHDIFHYSTDLTGHVSQHVNGLFVPRINNNFEKGNCLVELFITEYN